LKFTRTWNITHSRRRSGGSGGLCSTVNNSVATITDLRRPLVNIYEGLC
jgi:hypothetical protein